MSQTCDDQTMRELIGLMQANDDRAIDKLDSLVRQFPTDPRLPFMKASILVGAGNPIEAHQWFSKAIELAPDFAIARFQFGLFQLTSGEAAQALETWGRLDLLPDGHYLRAFVDGLRCLIRDDFEGARRNLRSGMASNDENLPLNGDMALLLRQLDDIENPTDNLSSVEDTANEDVSQTSLLLQQLGIYGLPN
jgi:Flp pilus assembly protein TadD